MASNAFPWIVGAAAAGAVVYLVRHKKPAASTVAIPPSPSLPGGAVITVPNLPPSSPSPSPSSPGLPPIFPPMPSGSPGGFSVLQPSGIPSGIAPSLGFSTPSGFNVRPGVNLPPSLSNVMAPDTSAAQLTNQLKTEIANLYKTSIDPQAFYNEADKLQALGYTTWANELRNYGDQLRKGILGSGEGKSY